VSPVGRCACRAVARYIWNDLPHPYTSPKCRFISIKNWETIGRELWELDQYRSDVPSINLVDIAGYGDPSAVAARLVTLFDTLPWEYTFTFELPEQLDSMLPASVRSYQLSPQVRIVRPNPEFSQEYPLTSDPPERAHRILSHRNSLLFLAARDAPDWNSARLHLQINASGFTGIYGGQQPQLHAEQMLRAFCGLGMAVRLFEFEETFTPVPLPSYVFVHKSGNDKGAMGESW
jgi:hypothetical protein